MRITDNILGCLHQQFIYSQAMLLHLRTMTTSAASIRGPGSADCGVPAEAVSCPRNDGLPRRNRQCGWRRINAVAHTPLAPV